MTSSAAKHGRAKKKGLTVGKGHRNQSQENANRASGDCKKRGKNTRARGEEKFAR